MNQTSPEPKSEAPAYRTSQIFTGLTLSAITLFALGALAIFVHLQDFAASAQLTLWGLAFFMSTIVIGFLFGIPRDGSRTVNNNLVEISDWLTKIIVGVGLTELHSLSTHVSNVTHFMVGEGGDTFSPSAAGATMIYFSALGFFHGYLLTRLVLNLRLMEASKSIESTAKEIAPEVKDASIPPEQPATETPPADPKLEAFARESPEQLKQPEDLATWAKVNLQLGHYDNAVRGYTRAAKKLPNDARIAAELGMAIYRQGSDAESAYKQLLRARDLIPASEPKLRRDIYKWLTYVSLYRPRPQGYEDAIKAANDYLALANAEPSAGLLVNKACALGQKYTDQKRQGADGETLAALEAAAHDALRQAIAVNPDYRSRIRRLLNGEIPGDDDLVVFRDRESFQYLVK